MPRPGVTQLLHELNDEARILVANSPDIMIRLNLDGTIGWVNPAWTHQIGHPSAEVKDKPFTEFVHRDDVGLLSSAFAHLRTEDLTRRTRFRMLTKAGGELWVGARGSFFNGLGRAYLIIRDVSLSMAYERELERERGRFETLLRYSMIGVSTLDATGIITYQSPTSFDILGYEPEELIGKNAFEFTHPEERMVQGKIFASLLADPGGRRRSIAQWRHRSGVYIPLVVHAWNLLNEEAVQAIVINFWRSDRPIGFGGGGNE